MKVVIVEPMKMPKIGEIGEGLKDLQDAVGGYIEAVYPFADNVCIVCNEEGKLMGLKPNRFLRDENGEAYDIICGTFLVVGLTEENFGSLTDEQAAVYMDKFRVPIDMSAPLNL